MNYARIASKLRVQILQFSGELSRGLPKVARRFVSEMIYGIQARQSVRLTEVSRSLSEPIPIKKTEKRLSRQLGNPELSPWCFVVIDIAARPEGHCQCGQVGNFIGRSGKSKFLSSPKRRRGAGRRFVALSEA